ncbi:MAG: transcriptional regulator [Candidatus Aminicenantes bacterium]|nr:transcriptional regulator [Candidatus Aminicenantes bacterium]
MTPSTFSPLDPIIHAPVRLAVLSLLVEAREADFNFLKTAAGTTDGNLSVHLAKLEEAGYIRIRKSFRGKKPLTTCALTEKGRTAFLDYLKSLERYLPRKTEKG